MFQGPVLTLSLAVFATMLGNCMVMSFLPIYVQQFGFGELGAGMLFSVHAATRTIILPFTGRLSDRWERKSFLLVGLFFYTLTSFAYLPAGDVISFILIMIVHGTATAIMHPVAMAYVGDLAPKGQEGTYSGYINTAMLGGIAGGPLLGGIIKDLFGMDLNFLIMGGLSTAALVSLPLLATRLLPLSTTEVGLLISLNVLVSTLLQAPCGRLADRVNKAYLIAIGGLGSVITLAFFPFAQEFWHLLVLNICVGGMYGLAFPSHTALAMEHGHQYGMGTVMSLLMMAHGFGMLIGPTLFGTIASQAGLGSAFWSGGIMGGVLIVACYLLTHGASLPHTETHKVLETQPAVAD